MTRDSSRISASTQSLLLTLTAFVLMAVSAWQFTLRDDEASVGRAVLAMLMGVAAAAAANRLSPPADEPPPPDDSTQPITLNPPARWLPVALGSALMALLMLINNDFAAVGILEKIEARTQFLLLAAGIALITWGMSGAPRPRRLRLARREWLPLALILLIALVLRVVNLENSLRFFVDEIHLSTGTSYFWGAHHARLLQPIGTLMPFPRIFPYWMSEVVALFGRNFTGLRVTSAIIGTLTVGALYLLARQCFDRRTALAAALIAATFPPFIHFSRLALINIADPLFGTLAVAFLARALRRHHRADYALSGMMLGAGQYFYEGGRLLFPALITLWLLGLALSSIRAALMQRSPRSTTSLPDSPSPNSVLGGLAKGETEGSQRLPPRRGKGVGLRFAAKLTLSKGVGLRFASGIRTLVVTALLVALPLMVTTATLSRAVKPRLSDAGLRDTFWRDVISTGDIGRYLERIDNPFLLYVRLPDEALYYGGYTPLVLPVFVPLFLLGVAYSLTHRDNRGAWVLVLWVVLTALGNSLLTSSTIAARFILVLPVLALLIAVGLRQTLAPLPPPLSRALLALFAVVIAVVQVGYYVGVHLPQFDAQFRAEFHPDTHDALLRSAHFPPETGVHLITTDLVFTNQYADQLIGYLADNVQAAVVTRDTFDHAYLLSLSRSVDQAFFVEPDDVDSVRLIQQYFPLGTPQTTPHAIPPADALLLYYYDAP